MCAIKYINLGATRRVILVGRYAIKFPTIGSGLRLFLLGILGNIQEARFGEATYPELAKVYWVSPLSLIIIMERVRPINHRGLYFIELNALARNSSLASEFILSDAKPENFGYTLDTNKFVKCDYGS